MESSTPFISCSMGVATACSAVTASAPTYVVESWIAGGAMSGNCAIGSWTIVTRPSITMRMEITIATIGRRTKKDATGSAPGCLRSGLCRSGGVGGGGSRLRRRAGQLGRRRLGRHLHARPHLLEAFDDDALAGGEPLRHHLERSPAHAGRDRAQLDRVVRADDRELRHALELLHRSLRHDERAAL